MIARAAAVAAVLALLLAPRVASPYLLTLLLPAFAYGIALLGLNLLFGTAGLLSFGHALFVALGAYTAAWLTTRAHVRALEVIVLAAAAVAAVIAVPVGLLCVRYVKIYFGMLTLAFGMLFYSFLYKFYALTGGDEGMRVLRPTLLGRAFAERDMVAFLTGPFYYYALALLAAAALVMWRIVRSPFGLSLRAIRENADKAAFVGVSVRRYRFYAFVIAGVFGGVGGALLAVPTGLADPQLAYWTHSGNLVFMLLLGGFQHFLGPIVGALCFLVLQDHVMSLTPYWRFAFGGLLAAIVIFLPGGLLSLLDRGRPA
ncbi:MAG TPA: branched-chain amino acid ABC transporter permease [Candidatus Binatia bacterium]|nr:branched-chain amino acid ABC transporter permease [Candidatus Binatia bacterium]